LAASGDDGEPSGYPAFSPNVVAVGGTTLSTDALGNYVSESGWSGSGGSISTVETLPAYQAGVVTQSTVRRANPDVAFDADPASGVPVYDSYDFGTVTPWIQVGGTSFSTPAWSAIIAIADQGRALQGLSSLDGATQTLPLLYQLPSTSYHDITSGNNGFVAAPGYDLVTGLGTPRVASIVGGLIGASISGTVFADADGNGVKDTGEIGLAGWTVFDDLNNDGVLQASSTASFNSSDVPKAIPDQKTITSTTTVSNVLGPISDVNVTLTIHHTFDRDLVITLIAPDGTKVTLANRNGSSADNFINTVFDDQASAAITSGSAPFTGTFRPVGLLAKLNGKNANGVWTLQVADVTRQDSGTLDSWSLSIATAGEPSETTDTSGGYQFVDVPPGDHHIREIPQTGFVQTSPVGAVYNVIMGTGSRVSNQDFGNAPVQPMVVPTVLGDFNKDGKTTGDDVPVLLLALTDPETYKATYNVTDAGLLMFGDLDGDHALTNADLQALLTLLNSGNSGGNPAVITTAASLNTVPTIVASSVSARLVAPNASSPVSQVVQPAGQDVVNAGTRYPIPSLHSRAIDAVLSRTGAFRSRHFRGRLEEPTAIHFGTLLG
jgi:subtilisin-like proprotein convertase family protein